MTSDLSHKLVHDNERVDLFIREDLKIIQSPDYFNFSLDAILLSEFIDLPAKKPFKYLDFCTGNGVIPIILSHRTQQPLQGIEIQADLVDMARRSVLLNGLEDQVEIIQGDLKDLQRPLDFEYDIISCNPPYFVVEDGQAVHQKTSLALARHEITLTLEDWVAKAANLLKDKGRLFFVHRPDRLDDIMETLLAHQFGIYRMQFAHPRQGQRANIVLVEAIYRGGRRGVRVEPPLIIHKEDGSYSDEMMAIYYG